MMGTHQTRTLIVTQPPQLIGGVAVKTRLLADLLRRAGHDVTMAYYAAHRLEPELNVTLPRLLSGRAPRVRKFVDDEGFKNIVVGCRLPEFEQSYTRSAELWTRLIDGHDRIVAVGGSPVIANPVIGAGAPHFLWCASDVDSDRESRQAAMSPGRRAVDRSIVVPALREQQLKIMQGSRLILGVSSFTVSRLEKFRVVDTTSIARLSIPVDTAFFTPDGHRSGGCRIGFVGRVADPRKNAALLLDALGQLHRRGANATLSIAGPPDEVFARLADRFGVTDRVEFTGYLQLDRLRAFYQSLDIFVIPSKQEGLGIVGLEAMASGVPVISTRCGGPEDYVVDDETGYLVNSDAEDVADKIQAITGDGRVRDRMSQAARAKMLAEFSVAQYSRDLARHWADIWGEVLDFS